MFSQLLFITERYFIQRLILIMWVIQNVCCNISLCYIVHISKIIIMFMNILTIYKSQF